MLKDGNSSTEILMDSDKILDYELLRKEAESNNQIALNVYDYLARYFAVTIHNIATILNPDTIILGGNFITLGQIMYEKIKKYLNLISIIPIDIRLSKIDYNAQLYGSIYFGMRYIDEKILSI